jgi:hypothetical protein
MKGSSAPFFVFWIFYGWNAVILTAFRSEIIYSQALLKSARKSLQVFLKSRPLIWLQVLGNKN